MIDRLVFEDVIGSVHFSSVDETFFGKLEGVNDLITFEGSSVKELKKSFIEAVKDYKALCEQTRIYKSHQRRNKFESISSSGFEKAACEMREIRYLKYEVQTIYYIMETNKTEKSFDAAKMMREIRDKISHETANMSFEEL